MAKETLGYVQLEWTCPNCGAKNPGTKTVCTGCGAAQPDDVQFEQAAQEEFITDEKLLERAKAGADIHCKFCGTRNPATATTCSQCGADIGMGTAREAGQVLGAHRKEAAAPINCPSCGTPNPATAHVCKSCGSSMAQRKPVEPKTAPTPAARKGISPILIGVGVLACIVVVVFAFLLLKTEDASGEVQSVQWTREIGVEALQPVSYETWRDEIPADGVVGSCQDKVHHTEQEEVADGKKVCGTPYTVDTGTGAGEVVQDCEWEVYAEWCEYTVDEWQEVNAFTVSGDDLSPMWPEFSIAGDEREGEYREEFEVVFSADGKNYTYEPDDEAEFVQYEIGSKWTLEVNALGGVVSVSK